MNWDISFSLTHAEGALLRQLRDVRAKRRLPRTEISGASVFKKWEEEEKQHKETSNKGSDCKKPKGRVCEKTDLSKSNFCVNQIGMAWG